jgi:P2-related tail formation protein
MTHYPDAVSPHRLNYDGGYSVYPLYLHNLMQAESVKDWRASNGSWVPNWNSEAYITRLLALHQAINNHINTTSYNGVAYKDVINYIDVRGYGAFGEWHSYTIVDVMSQYPAGTRATTTSLNRIIDTHVDGFPNFPLVMLVSAFDGNRLGNTMNPPEVAYHALTRRNSWGPLGWRRDNWGATDTYLRWYTDQNTLTVNGMRLDTAIMNRWKYAPIVGEPCCNANYADLETQVRRYHAVSFGNGNFSPSSTINPNIRAASKAAGYRIVLEGGNVPASVSTGTSFGINLQWKNVGLTQSYEDWQVLYELKNSSGTAVWSSASSFQMKHFMPETNARSHTDNVTLPGSVNAGTYTLTVKVRDVDGFRQPMPLAITGRNSDGSYNIRTVTVTTGNAVPNQPPVANAGSNQTITLPTNSVQLSGTASSDADGTISSYQWQQTNGPSTASLSATNTANVTAGNLQQGTYTFQLTVTDNGGLQHSATVTITVNAAPVTNQPPVANAGPDRTVTLPTSSASLTGSGSSDADGTISSYLWQQVSGPSTATLSATNTANITVSGLQQGVYVFRITVRDNDNATDTDEVTVTVNAAANQAPVANAGSNRTITLPTNSVGLNGSASTDSDGTISSYLWQQVSGPSTATLSATNTANITASNLQQGVYVFRLTVRDNDNASDFDEVTVTVNAAPVTNQPPVANAGANRTITLPTNSVGLNGSASADSDGTISSYLWQQVSGPSTATLSATNTANITVSALQQGVYVFRLTVRDNDNATDSDEVTVTVNAAPVTNQPPVANAGSNRTITLPTNSVGLNGSASTDSDGTISSYLWQQVSGPSTATLSATNTANITVSALQQGVYVFRLTVRDNDNASDSDDVTVTVNAAANQSPVASAGPNRVVTLPTSTASLIGIGSSDPDGTISSYLWQQVSGPSTATLSASNIANIIVSALQQGVYVFRLTVRDNDNATATDEVTVTVNAAANQPPVANAGPNRIVTLPTNTASLIGIGSSDPDGTISSYLWQQVSGPSTATLSSTNNANITVRNLELGVYIFRLTVRDNNNAAAVATVQVTVNAAPNQGPVAVAGDDQSATVGGSAITLNGSDSYDPDGSITSYSWRQISGPGTTQFSATNTAQVTISGMIAGDYEYTLTVRDDRGATDVDTLKVSVIDNFAGFGQTQALYPNPANDQTNLRILFQKGGILRINIYDMRGKSVLPSMIVEKPEGPHTVQLNISRLRPGTYVVETVMVEARKRLTTKLLKR